LTRAWLIAGAKAVVATNWPVEDDSGEFFTKFYAFLRQNSTGGFTAADVAQAVRAAQSDQELKTTAQYWASVFVVAKE
jgi:CHAT domain-containing protein